MHYVVLRRGKNARRLDQSLFVYFDIMGYQNHDAIAHDAVPMRAENKLKNRIAISVMSSWLLQIITFVPGIKFTYTHPPC